MQRSDQVQEDDQRSITSGREEDGAVHADDSVSDEGDGDGDGHPDAHVSDSVAAALRAFARAEGLDENVYLVELPRFFRVPAGSSVTADLASQMLRTEVRPVPWLPGFFSYRCPQRNLASTELFKRGQVFGMDASSGVAVAALGIEPGDHVLDLCCAPGGKLAMMADLAGASGSATGVDISADRLNVCRALMRKYHVPGVRLWLGDATRFSVPAPRSSLYQQEALPCLALPAMPATPATADLPEYAEHASSAVGTGAAAGDAGGGGEATPASTDAADCATARPTAECRKRAAPTAPRGGRAKRAERKAQRLSAACGARLYYSTPNVWPRTLHAKQTRPEATCAPATASFHSARPEDLYDRVLVDAECSHDGSVKHVRRTAAAGGLPALQALVSPQRQRELSALQHALLWQGFQLLRPGGTLVYSTCSFSRLQNEQVVRWLLSVAPEAVLEPLAGPTMPDGAAAATAALPGALRLDPQRTQTSGLFIARVRRRNPWGPL